MSSTISTVESPSPHRPPDEFLPQSCAYRTLQGVCASTNTPRHRFSEVSTVWAVNMDSNMPYDINDTKTPAHSRRDSSPRIAWQQDPARELESTLRLPQMTSSDGSSDNKSLTRTDQTGLHVMACWESRQYPTDPYIWVSTPWYEMLLRSIFNSDWGAVAEVAKDMQGRASTLDGHPLCAYSSIVLAAMKETLVRDVWHRSWTQCARGARAVDAVLECLGRQVPDGFSADMLCALKHSMLEAVSAQDWDSLHSAARLTHDLTRLFHRSLPNDYGDIMSSMAAGVVQSLHRQDWEGAASKALNLKEICKIWHSPLASYRGDIASAMKRLLMQFVLDRSWEDLAEAVRCIAVVANSLDAPLPDSASNAVFSAMKARLIRLAAESSWIQLDHRFNTALQIAHTFKIRLPNDYTDVVFAVIDEVIANFSRRDWLAAYAAAAIARRVADRWNEQPRGNSDNLVVAMRQTFIYLLSIASWDDAEQGALFSQFIASTLDMQLPDSFYSTIMYAWKDSFVQVVGAADWTSAKQAAKCATAMSLSFRRKIPQDISDGVVGEMRQLFVEWASRGDLSPVGEGVDLMITDLAPLVNPVPAEFFADVLAAVNG